MTASMEEMASNAQQLSLLASDLEALVKKFTLT
jgi:methyl-accepting chemotaxis protein